MRFLRGTLLLSSLAAIVALAVVPAPAADDKKSDGEWVSLFNGKDLTGWKLPNPPSGSFKSTAEKKNAEGKVTSIVGTPTKGDDITIWRVEDGLLIGGGPMTHLYTEGGDYDNFAFRVEVKINDKGNSGMFFRAGFRPGVPKGYECQINATHGDKVKSGSIYPNGEFGLDKFKPMTCVMDKAAHKPDEFFVQEVIADGPMLTTIINGVKQIEWTDPKNTFTKGHFALQGHDPGSIMTFKKVEYKPLKK